ncbi:MAG: Na/Pi symporter [Candidatus Deferrimicrobiaceae bacterium]
MLKKIFFPSILIVLAYGFYASANFKEIAAGVALFLFGMISLEEGFRAFSGGVLERFLKKSTDKLYKSIGFGVVTTTLMQSSSLVSVITISFLSAGMIGLYQGLGIVFGANLGTTTGAWLIAGFGLKVKISAYAMPMLVFGVVLVMFQKSKAFKGIGYILAGLGFLFLGIHHMKVGFEAFKSTIDMSAYAVPGFAGLLLFTLIGIVATVVMQSSHATLVLILTALGSGQISYENALALAIGANVGTTITAILGSLTANIEGKRLAGGHFLFNVVTGLMAIILIGPFMSAVEFISASVGIAAKDYTLKLAVFHTLFNLAGLMLMIPFLGGMVKLLEKTMPAKQSEYGQPRYLTESSTEFGETAIEAARREIEHLYDNGFFIMAHALDFHRSEILSDQDLEAVANQRGHRIEIDIDEDYDTNVKGLYGAIIKFLAKAQAQIPADQTDRVFDLRKAALNVVEAIKGVKHMRKNLSKYTVSDNAHIRDEYNKMRVLLGTIMRHLAQIQNADNAIARTTVEDLKQQVKTVDVLVNGVLDNLIRNEHISEEMATSLINDSAYARHVSRHLLEMAVELHPGWEASAADHAADVSLVPETVPGHADAISA